MPNKIQIAEYIIHEVLYINQVIQLFVNTVAQYKVNELRNAEIWYNVFLGISKVMQKHYTNLLYTLDYDNFQHVCYYHVAKWFLTATNIPVNVDTITQWANGSTEFIVQTFNNNKIPDIYR